MEAWNHPSEVDVKVDKRRSLWRGERLTRTRTRTSGPQRQAKTLPMTAKATPVSTARLNRMLLQGSGKPDRGRRADLQPKENCRRQDSPAVIADVLRQPDLAR